MTDAGVRCTHGDDDVDDDDCDDGGDGDNDDDDDDGDDDYDDGDAFACSRFPSVVFCIFY